MEDSVNRRLWIRSGVTREISGPFDYENVVALAREQQLMPYDRIALSEDGPWIAPTDVHDLATAMRDGKAANRTFAALIPHLGCIAAVALLGFVAPRLTENAINGARLAVALCSFVVAAAYDDPVPRAPRWLFVVIGTVFLIPLRIPLNRGGWLLMDWLTACAAVLHGRGIVQRIKRPSILVKVIDQVFNATVIVLFLASFAILRCEGSGDDFD